MKQRIESDAKCMITPTSHRKTNGWNNLENVSVGKRENIDLTNQILMVPAVSFRGSSFRGWVSLYKMQLESTQCLKCDAISAKVASMVQSQCCQLLLCL